MKKLMVVLFVAMAALLVAGIPANAGGPGYYGRGHGPGPVHHGYYGHGYYGHGGGFYGSIYIGPGWWGPAYYPSPYYYYPYYAQPPVVIQQQAPTYEYEQQAPAQEQTYYWYFCPDANNYYPYVKQCPGGWKKVVPKPPDNGRE